MRRKSSIVIGQLYRPEIGLSLVRGERRQDLIEHEVVTLIGQRVFGIALGYEDLNDHDELRHDPMMAVLAGKLEARRHEDCAPVAGKSTLNRLELSCLEPTRYHEALLTQGKAAFKTFLEPLYHNRGHVYAKPPFAGPQQVLAYLARYTHRVAISNSRLIKADETGVTFRYKDYRIKGAKPRSGTKTRSRVKRVKPIVRHNTRASKRAAVVALLNRPQGGATIAAIIEATGWQSRRRQSFSSWRPRTGMTTQIRSRPR
jgi:hypothetical protein